jgi:hypothetical protein
VFQFINDLNILIECNAKDKIGMLVQHINKNLTRHAGYTDLILVLKNFLAKTVSYNQLHCQYGSKPDIQPDFEVTSGPLVTC